jgi:hypothetical protein
MSNLYHKFAVASVGIALGFALVANKEAKAATFTLRDSGFLVADSNLDGLGDWHYGGVALPVGIRRGENFTGTEYRSFYQFNIAQLSLASNTVITSAIFTNSIRSVERIYHPHHDAYLQVSGYVGNGSADRASYFSREGVSLGSVRLFESSPGRTFNLNVTTFVNQIVSNRESFAEFGFRTNPIDEDPYYGDNGYDNDNDTYVTLGGYPYPDASLTITTVDAEPVPEPTTIFGSLIGLCLGGWLKRKKSSQHNKVTP